MPYNPNFPATKYSIQRQYADTNINTLLGGVAKIRGAYKSQAVETFRTDIRNLKTAIGDSLDLWGKLLNFPRYLPVNRAPNTYNEFVFTQSNYVDLQFGRYDKDKFERLADTDYRTILLLILQGRNTLLNIKNLNDLAVEFFDQFGLRCAVFDIWERTAIRYVVDDIPPLWLRYVIQNYKVLPRPTGVAVEFLIDKVKPIGFYRPPPAPPESNLEITNFDYAKFNS